MHLAATPAPRPQSVRCFFSDGANVWLAAVRTSDLGRIVARHGYKPGIVGSDGVTRMQYRADNTGGEFSDTMVISVKDGRFVSWPDPYDVDDHDPLPVVDCECLPPLGPRGDTPRLLPSG